MGTHLYCSHSVKWQGTYGATCITGVAGDGTHSYAPAPARARVRERGSGLCGALMAHFALSTSAQGAL